MTNYQFLFLNILIFAGYATSSPLNASCTVSNYNDVAAAAKSCSTLTLKAIVIPEKKTLEIDLQTGAKLIFDGHISHVPVDWTGDLIVIKGTNVDISGTSNHILDGMGPKHWKGGDEPHTTRPKLLRLKLQGGQVKGLHLLNCPHNCMQIHSSDIVVSNILIDNRDGYPAKAGSKYAKNTDGFDVGSGSTNVRVKNSIVYNQDDCVAVNGGNNLLFDNLWCNGSHGFSFSVSGGDVHDVEFRNSHIQFAGSAIHIKTHPDGTTGHIYDVLYNNITFASITGYAISIQQNYPKGEAKANVPITNLTLNKVEGTTTGNKGGGFSIICADKGCSNWKWTDVKVTGAHEKDVCEHVPSGIKC